MALSPAASIILASAARTTSGTGTAVLHREPWVGIGVEVTAVSGTTPTLDIAIEWSLDGGTSWWVSDPASLDVFAQITAAVRRVRRLEVPAPVFRPVWTIGGTTPSFTFAIRMWS